MKKNTFIAYIAALTLAFFNNHAVANEILCPPSDLVAKTIFKYAYSTGNNWRLISDPFLAEGKYWNVEFEINLPDAKDRKEAISQGQSLFTKSIVRPFPYPECKFCRYDYSIAKHVILARPQTSF